MRLKYGKHVVISIHDGQWLVSYVLNVISGYQFIIYLFFFFMYMLENDSRFLRLIKVVHAYICVYFQTKYPR